MTAGERIGARPRIGITSGHDDIAEYIYAVREAGGEPVRLAPDRTQADADLARLDGIVFSGGADVDPARYGEAPHPATDADAPDRDAYELAMMHAAFAQRLPTLAICRGVQVANVAFGGSLIQHVPDAAVERVRHRIVVDGASVRGLIDGHRVEVAPGSRLASLVGPELVTGSRHHQAVARVAAGFRAVAHATDHVIEALEPSDAAWFWLGVQWHPESTLLLDEGRSRAIFRALVEAAAANALR